jgi:hypothetical protein
VIIRLKNNDASLVGLCPQMNLAITMLWSHWARLDVDLVITSANDSRHSRTSLHYDGKAIDVRSKNIRTQEQKLKLQVTVDEALGPDFDFILEGLGSANEHFHLEWQPKRRD